MPEHTYRIKLSSADGAGIPNIDAEFGRITVLLGANGTGKSRALRRIRDMGPVFGIPDRPVVYIEGGRAVPIPHAIAHDYNTFNEFGTLARALATFQSRRLSPVVNRVRDVFYLLERKDAELRIDHSDAVTKWQQDGCNGPCPLIQESQLGRLFRMFSEVFPEITIRIEGEDKRIVCYKASQPYSTTELSDGERQVLFVLADIALSAEKNSLIVVDEPELNLNAQLASRLWDTIQNHLPEAIFVYGTHNISFAMRPSVDRLIALSGRGEPALQLDSITDIHAEDARELLGAIPAILAAPAAIAVEGTETSFDASFYEWLVGRPEIAIVALGNCHDVVSATTRTGIWDKIAPSIRLAGVIDRDYRDNSILSLDAENCIVLDFHEAESYLCHPVVFCSVASALGTADSIPTEEEITQLIFEYSQQTVLRTAATRMAARANIALNVSLQPSTFRYATDEASLRKIIETEANKEASKANTYVGAEAVSKIFDEELRRCQKALDDRDMNKILQFVPGKELLAQLAPRAGCKDASMLARAVYKHFNPADFELLQALRQRIATILTGP